jgi:hypothetical protein
MTTTRGSRGNAFIEGIVDVARNFIRGATIFVPLLDALSRNALGPFIKAMPVDATNEYSVKQRLKKATSVDTQIPQLIDTAKPAIN